MFRINDKIIFKNHHYYPITPNTQGTIVNISKYQHISNNPLIGYQIIYKYTIDTGTYIMNQVLQEDIQLDIQSIRNDKINQILWDSIITPIQ